MTKKKTFPDKGKLTPLGPAPTPEPQSKPKPKPAPRPQKLPEPEPEPKISLRELPMGATFEFEGKLYKKINVVVDEVFCQQMEEKGNELFFITGGRRVLASTTMVVRK